MAGTGEHTWLHRATRRGRGLGERREWGRGVGQIIALQRLERRVKKTPDQAGVTFLGPSRTDQCSQRRSDRKGPEQRQGLAGAALRRRNGFRPAATQVCPSLPASLKPPRRERRGPLTSGRCFASAQVVSGSKHVNGSRSRTLSSAHPNVLPPLPGGHPPNRRVAPPD
jgi:hypothetical protein